MPMLLAVTAQPLSLLGGIFMVVSVTFVTVLTLWSFKRVLSSPPEDHVVKPPDSLGG